MGFRRSLRELLNVRNEETFAEPSGWLAENVFCQSSMMPLDEVYQQFHPNFSDPDLVNLVHITNFCSVDGGLDNVQRGALDSMLTASSGPLAG